jgi:hypothetical protein
MIRSNVIKTHFFTTPSPFIDALKTRLNSVCHHNIPNASLETEYMSGNCDRIVEHIIAWVG